MNDGLAFEKIDEYTSLLKKYFDGQLNKEERVRLARWLRQDRKNRELFMNVRSISLLKEHYERRSEIDTRQEFDLLVWRYPRVRGGRRVYAWCYVAAAVVLLLIIGGGIFFSTRTVPENTPGKTVSAGKLYALLTTADGKVVPICQGSESGDNAGFRIKDSIKQLVCGGGEMRGDTVCYHRLDIPRGGEYSVVLEDGTLVRLNSESSIRFPEFFSDSTRGIEVRGEVYLEVAKDVSRPFIVESGRLRTEVLGTRFGMSVYPAEDLWMTTLAEGCVRVTLDGEDKLVLNSGQQAYVVGSRLEKREVNVDKELAWVQGFFVFEHDELVHVVNRLSRWYDVTFVFDDENLKAYQFTGTVSRDYGLDRILDLIERMNIVTFEKSERSIVIKTNGKAGKYN
ncbi:MULTISPECIES: FecR domain-containing protein [unclassified Butyricimonas]|uniref:FecR domain-containing protein n=1 Tax=Butyricimonas TaxID=574697 RepID=UPI000C080C5F|nr:MULTISPECIES: FecR domain-containing protein [unclassified Butyricimonas]